MNVSENIMIMTKTPMHSHLGVLDSINEELSKKFDCGIVSIPEVGIAKTRKLLSKYGLTFTDDVPIDPAGDEIAIEISEQLYLYVIYYLNEDNVYDFYCELIDDVELDNILNEVEEDDTNN